MYKIIYSVFFCFFIITMILSFSNCKKSYDRQEVSRGNTNYLLNLKNYKYEEKTIDLLMKKYGCSELTKEEKNEIISNIKWETNTNISQLASKEAKKGGRITLANTNYPPTIRPVGEGSNTAFNSTISSLMYETLTNLDPITLETTPGLANKWSISDDYKTYFFHIDPRAKWHDGKPVTAFDYVATYDLMIHPDINSPFQNDYWKKYERPVALSPSVVMIKANELEWRLFLSAGGSLTILPEHIIGRMTVKEFMKKYHSQPLLGSGPYYIDRVLTNREITFQKFNNWWGENIEETEGMYNFDRIRFLFFTEENLVDENLKKGDIDINMIRMARKWAEDFTAERENIIKNNWLKRQRVYTHTPNGISGISFNTRIEPFDDIRVRKAFAHLINREKMMTSLFYNEYEYMNSFYPNSIYENPNNPKVKYDFMKAIDLLEEAGWKQSSLNDQGYLVRNGKVFELDLNIVGDDSRIQNVIQEDLKKAGIKLNLRRVTWPAHIKDLDERNFKIISIAYTGLIFPNPENSLHSRFADLPNTNNLWGFKNERVDELSEKYNVEFDINKRIEMVKEIDNIVTNEYIKALYWYSDNTRILYWNKFGMPEFVLSRFDNDYISSVATYWWFDEEKEKELIKARRNNIKLPDYEEEVNYWKQYE